MVDIIHIRCAQPGPVDYADATSPHAYHNVACHELVICTVKTGVWLYTTNPHPP